MKQPRVFFAATLGAAVLAGALGVPAPARAESPITISPAPRTLPTPQVAPAPTAPGLLPAPGVLPRGAAPNPAALAAAAQAAAEETKAIAAVAAEIAGQQAIMAENQKQIETKLAFITGNLRIARAYVARGGGAPK